MLAPPLDKLEDSRFKWKLTQDGTFSTKGESCLSIGSRSCDQVHGDRV